MNIFRIMPFIDYKYLINLLDTPLENFKNELITHKVSEINCNFIEYIICDNPDKIKYLDEYYKHFNQMDINIIKNARNLQGCLLVDIYRNFNQDLMHKNVNEHISFFLKAHDITDNIIDLFSFNFSNNTQNINMVNEDNLATLHEFDNEYINKIRCDINKNKEDIIMIKNEMENFKKDIYTKLNKLYSLINPKYCNDT
jgi:hypothetical protein